MAYKFQKGTAQLSGTIKLDSGYDLTGAGSNDIGSSGTPFAVAYASVVSASTVVSGAFFEGSGARLTDVAATDITTTGTSTDSDFFPLFVDTSAGESGETIRVHSTVKINPSKGKVTATIFSSSAGTGSFGGGISAGNEGFTVGYTGALTAASLNNSSGGITNAGAIAGATTISGSGALSVGAGATFAGAVNLQAGGITNAGAIAAATTISGSGLLSPAGGINVAEEFTVSSAGAVVAKTVSGSGALSVGAGATFAGAVNLQAGGITNAGSIAGGTTLALSGLASVASISMDDGSTLGPDSVADLVTFAADGDITVKDGAYDFNIAAHDGTNGLKLGGVLVNASAADLNFTNVAAAGTVEASKAVVVDSNKDITGFRSITASANVYADKLFGDGTGITGISSDAVDVTASTANQAFGLTFTEAAQSDGSLGLAVQMTGATFNPAKAELVIAGVVSGSGALSVGAGATLAGALNMQAGGITNAGSIAGATTISGSGLLSPAGGINVAETFTVSAAGAVIADQYKTDGNEFVVSTAGLVTATGIANSNAGITNAGSLAGVTTVSASAAIESTTVVSGAMVQGTDMQITQAGVFYFGAKTGNSKIGRDGGANDLSFRSDGSLKFVSAITASSTAGLLGVTATSLNMQNGGITNAGDVNNVAAIQGVTGSGLILDVSMGATGGSYVSLKDNLAEAFFVAQGADTYLTFVTTNDSEMVKSSMDFMVGDNVNSGKFLSLNGGIDFAGQKLLTASVNLDEEGSSGIYHVHSHYIVSGSSAVTINLPSLENGYSLWFKRHPSMTADVTIHPSGSTNTIDGLNDPVVLESAGASLQLVGSGSKHWYIY